MNLRIVRWIDIFIGIPLVYLLLLQRSLFRYKRARGQNYKKILLVKFWGVGNVIMLLPAAQALKERFPGVQIDFLTLRNNKEVSESANIFDNIYCIDLKNLNSFIITLIKKTLVLRSHKYDLIVDFEQFVRFSILLCSFIGNKDIIGFNTTNQHRHYLYTKSIPYNNVIHITKSFFNLVESAGAIHRDCFKAVPIIINIEHIDEMVGILGGLGIYKEGVLVILHVGTSNNFRLRRWPPEYFAELADRLIDRFGVKVIFTGLANEAMLAKRAMFCIKNKKSAVDASGRFNFNQFISLIKLSDLVISADTSPVHIASALSVPTVGLYGPNTPLLYGPWGERSIWFYKYLHCSPCITNYNAKIYKCRNPEGEGACMKQISVDEVFRGVENNFFNKNAKFRLNKISNK